MLHVLTFVFMNFLRPSHSEVFLAPNIWIYQDLNEKHKDFGFCLGIIVNLEIDTTIQKLRNEDIL